LPIGHSEADGRHIANNPPPLLQGTCLPDLGRVGRAFPWTYSRKMFSQCFLLEECKDRRTLCTAFILRRSGVGSLIALRNNSRWLLSSSYVCCLHTQNLLGTIQLIPQLLTHQQTFDNSNSRTIALEIAALNTILVDQSSPSVF
jgi:hypothetical protein